MIMDDILVHGRNREEHDARLNAVLRIINDSGLKLNPKKCVFRKNELTYFGHLLWGDDLKPDPEMVEALLEPSEQRLRTENSVGYVSVPGQVRARYVVCGETND